VWVGFFTDLYGLADWRGLQLSLPPRTSGTLTVEHLHLEEWAWRLAADVYRLNLFAQLTGRTVSKRSAVTEEELAGAIRNSFTQLNEAAYREMVKLATDAALETYDRLVSRTIKLSHAQRAN
jgi:hypothetical protein